MRRKLYLHAGIHRTGTTYLQQCLFQNREVLASYGLIYPFGTVNHEPILQRIMWGASVAGIAEEIESTATRENDAIVLSCEDFCTLRSEAWLGALAERFDVQILVYLRRQDHWLSSWYNQNTKWPFDPNFFGLSSRDYFDRLDDFYWLDYSSFLDRWAKIVGTQSIQVGVVGRGQVSDVLPDFLAKIGLPIKALPCSPVNVGNESISPYAAEVLRHLLPHVPPFYYWSIIREVIAITAHSTNDSKMVFSPGERREIMANFTSSNATVADKFLSRQDGRLFLEPDVSDSDPYTNATLPPSERLIEHVVTPLIARILDGRSAAFDAKRMADRWVRGEKIASDRLLRDKVAPLLVRVLDGRPTDFEIEGAGIP